MDLTPEQINELAQAIRVADGSHNLGAGALAEALAPTVAAMLNAAQVEAWQDGWEAGWDAHEYGEQETPNPYVIRAHMSHGGA